MSRDDDQLRLPLVLGPVLNGEFLPAAAGPGDVRLAEEALARAGAAAGRLRMDCRRFLRSGRMAALLGAINAAACNGPGRRLATAHPGKGYHGIRVTARPVTGTGPAAAGDATAPPAGRTVGRARCSRPR